MVRNKTANRSSQALNIRKEPPEPCFDPTLTSDHELPRDWQTFNGDFLLPGGQIEFGGHEGIEQLIKDNKDRTALDIARERGHALAVRLLQRASPSLKMRVVNMVTGSDGTRALLYFYLVNGTLCYIGYALLLAPAVGSTLWHRMYV